MEFLLFTFPVLGNGKSRELEHGLCINNGYNALNS